MDLKRQEEFYKKVVNDQLKYQYDMKMKALESEDSESSFEKPKPPNLVSQSSNLSGKSRVKDISP